MIDNGRFLGITKWQFLIAQSTLIVALLIGLAIVLLRIDTLATQGAQSHAAVCSYHGFLNQQLESSRHFLTLTPAQITHLYGKQFAHIPHPIQLQTIAREKAALTALNKKLTC